MTIDEKIIRALRAYIEAKRVYFEAWRDLKTAAAELEERREELSLDRIGPFRYRISDHCPDGFIVGDDTTRDDS